MEQANLFLTFNDLSRVQLKSVKVQGFDTKWDEVFLSMKIIPDEDISENLYKNQLHFSEESMPLMALYLQASSQKGEAVSNSRLKENGPP